ncbi:hypothetical protein WJX74_003969 [Apatococcus lobatus]|uniref:RRM domain-containing protein n=1 Tax=Apatococcus lobatus TaxID=904363 RepID=A0AAW1RGT7_9CHLO
MSSFSGRPPSRTAFIGNLPFGVTEDLLMDICSEAGPVKFFRLVADAKTGDPKGFAFCEYFDVASVQNAIRLLNNKEVMGRKIRLDYGTDQAITGTEGKPGVIRQMGNSQAVGMDAAKSAAQNMQMLLPGAGQTTAPSTQPDTITSIIAGMSRPELYAIISQVKTLIQQDAKQVRALLIGQPNLARALFQAQVALGMLPLPQTNGGMPHTAGPSPQHPQQPPPGMVQQQQQQQPPHLQHNALPQGQGHAGVGTSAGYGAGGTMPYQQQMQTGPQVSDPRTDPRRNFQQQQQQQQQQAGPDGAQYQQPFPGPTGQQPGQQQNPQGFVQQQQQQPQQQTPQSQQQQQQQQPQFGLAQQQALLQQVMNLTPQQIDLLPEQQKLQVLTLQKQMRGQSS